MQRIVFACVSLAVVCVPTWGQQESPPTLRPIYVTAHVVDQAGGALANVPLLMTSHDGCVAGTTNMSGEVMLGSVVTSTSAREFFKLGSLKELGVVPGVEQDAEVMRVEALRSEYSFPLQTWVTLQPGVRDYQVTLSVPRAIRLSTSFVSSAGAPHQGSCTVLGRLAWGKTSATGVVELGGLPQGVVSSCAFTNASDGYTRVFEVNPGSADTLYELPPRVFDIPTRTIGVSGQINDREVFAVDPSASGDYVTLVSASGDEWFEFAVSEAGALVGTVSQRRVPLGTYYVVPGPGLLGRYPMEVRKLLHAERGAELEAGGVPKVVAVAGGADIVIAMSASQARNTIATLSGIAW